MKKQIVLIALTLTLLASAVMTAAAGEIVGTILFEPKQGTYAGYAINSYEYSIATGENSRVADKNMGISYGNAGEAIYTLPNYLVKGTKIVYENEGMRKTMGEYIRPERLIAIITEDGYYIELTEIVSSYGVAYYFNYL